MIELSDANTERLKVGMVYNISTFPPWPVDWFPFESMNSFDDVLAYGYQPWIYSIVAACVVGVAGILPLLFIPADYEYKKNNVSSFNILQLLLSFAVGGLLADVFLHLLPEAWTAAINEGSNPNEAFTGVGLCVLGGIFLFIIVEMMATAEANADVDVDKKSQKKTANGTTSLSGNGKQCSPQKGAGSKHKVIGYLNLIANGIDNFAHGLAVAGSFLVSYKTGVLTTIAILIHEIPHEIGDFAILLKAGFSRWEAAWAQLYTASIGLLGALLTLFLGTTDFMGGLHVYILGFTAGGFLNIALVSVLPDLLREERPIHSAAQLGCLLLGILTMASVAMFC